MTVDLAYDVQGPPDAPLLVLGSSLGTDRSMWAAQIPALVGPFRVLRYDHRGHGASPGPEGPYRIDDLAGDVLELVDRIGAGRFGLVGLSLGGMVAMRLAAAVPDRVGALAVLCTSAHLPPEPWWDRAAAVRRAGTAVIADAVVDRWFTTGYAEAWPVVVAGLRQCLLDASRTGYAGCCDAIAEMDLRPVLASITAPTLVVAGADDRAIDGSHARTIADGIPDARLEVVPGAHLASVESARWCTQLLLEHFLTRQENLSAGPGETQRRDGGPARPAGKDEHAG